MRIKLNHLHYNIFSSGNYVGFYIIDMDERFRCEDTYKYFEFNPKIVFCQPKCLDTNKYISIMSILSPEITEKFVALRGYDRSKDYYISVLKVNNPEEYICKVIKTLEDWDKNWEGFKEPSISYKERVKLLLEFKNKKLEEHCLLPLYTSEDFKDLETNFTEEECEMFWGDFYNDVFYANDTNFNSDSCIWCYNYYQNSSCDKCSYGKRHGLCEEPISRYNKLMRVVNKLDFDIITNDDYRNFIEGIN